MLKAIFRAIFGYENKDAEVNYPRYCESMRKLLSSGRPYTISELQKTLKKRKGTVYHEMTELRRGGLVIAKDYDKSISANKYRITS